MNFYNLNKKKFPFVIAEIGNNHEGNFDTAVKLINAAKIADVDAVKFQTFKTENFINKNEKKRFKKLKKFELSYEEFYKLSKIAKKKNLKFISTPLDKESAFFLKSIVNIFKISSGDNNYYDLIEQVLSYKKPTIISTGMMNIKDIKDLITIARKKKFSLSKLAMLHCVSSYPVQNQHANLLSIKYMIEKLPVTVGYSDHTIGTIAPICAAILGAKILEKHFTLDNNFSSFRDHKLSLNPNDMKTMVNQIKKVDSLMGKKEKKPNFLELKTESEMRRSLYAKSNIRKGQKISVNDINVVRPFVHLSPNDLKKIVGKKFIKNFKSGSPII